MSTSILKQLWFDYCNDHFKGMKPSDITLLDECAPEIEEKLGSELSEQVENLIAEQCSNSEMHGFFDGVRLGAQLYKELLGDDTTQR